MLGSILDQNQVSYTCTCSNYLTHTKSTIAVSTNSVKGFSVSLYPTTGTCHNQNCTYNLNYDINTYKCVSTTLNCTTVNSKCTAVINSFSRGCQFMNIGANVSQPIHCCLCSSTQPSGLLLWDCSIVSPSLSLLPSGEHSSCS